MSTSSAIEFYKSEFAAKQSSLLGNGIDWLDAIRSRALGQFEALGLPGRGNELWKYTRLKAFEKSRFECPTEPVSVDAVDHFEEQSLDAYRLVFVDGFYEPSLSDLEGLPPTTRLLSFGELLVTVPPMVQALLEANSSLHQSAFAQLNTAFTNQGMCLMVQPGTALDKPVLLLHVMTGQQRELASHPRNFIIAGDNSQVTVLESYVGQADNRYFVNRVTEVHVGNNASVDHYISQREGSGATHIANTQVQMRRDSRYQSHTVSLGAVLARTDIEIALAGEGAECVVNGLTIARGKQHIDDHTLMNHVLPRGRTRELYKGIYDGHSRGVFNGKIHVHKNAQKTDAQMSNANLLLSADAEVDTKPELEIYADDVQCAHGTTVGQLDENSVFYLRSRGIGEETARNMMMAAFASEVLDSAQHPGVKALLTSYVADRLPNPVELKELL